MLAELEQHGVSLKEVTDELVTEGVRQFADAFDKLFGAIARRRGRLLEGETRWWNAVGARCASTSKMSTQG